MAYLKQVFGLSAIELLVFSKGTLVERVLETFRKALFVLKHNDPCFNSAQEVADFDILLSFINGKNQTEEQAIKNANWIIHMALTYNLENNEK
jgi:hypothetical protein